MKKIILLSYLSLFLAVGVPYLMVERTAAEPQPQAESAPLSSWRETSPEPPAAPSPESPAGERAPETITVLTPEGNITMTMQDYLVGVVAAEMPASFEPEALKAQAVAARTYALYQASSGKHGEAQVCTDYACCQAWHSDETLRQNWGESYETNLARICAAVSETDGQYLAYEGRAVFAAFHSSSAGATEDCGEVWNAQPYLVSVSSPETAENVPNYVSSVACAAIDFRDTLLSAHPEADFTGDAAGWLGGIERDASGRISSAVLGGVAVRGTELRSLFKLRSTAFTLTYADGVFTFTVTGYGHGVGMSQYGANVMAANGSSYAEILAHYYPGTVLVNG